MDSPGLKSRYEELLARHGAALQRLADAYTRDSARAEDLLQEIATALWTALPRFRGDSSERTWLYRVAHNTAISFVAQHARRNVREETLGELLDPPSLAASPEDAAIDAQRRRRLQEAVSRLALIDRQIVLLYLEGLSAVEIEAVTGMSAGNVATRLTRARQALAAERRREEVQ